MVTKLLKWCLIMVVIAGIIGGLLFGKDLISYLRSSAKSVQSSVKDNVPIEFELCRARDLLEDILPEMHANIRLIAQEEVGVANLKSNITQSETELADASGQIKKLRQNMQMQNTSYSFGGHQSTRRQVKEDLNRRFEHFKESELVLASKKRLLVAREKSLQAAVQLLERTRAQKRLLADKIEGLTSQYRLVKASAVGTKVQVDNSKLAQTEKLISQIKKRLDVSERILAHESKFVTSIPLDSITETDLLTQIDEYFTPTTNKSIVIADEAHSVCLANNER